MKSPTEERIQHLQTKLQMLKKLDVQHKIFGTDFFVQEKQYGHQYEILPVTEEELKGWEISCNIKLPEEYREYLKLVGYGTGPAYGLLSPSAARDTYIQLLNSISYYVETADTGGWYEKHDFNKDTGYGRITYFHELKKKHVNRYRRMLEAPTPEEMDIYTKGYYYANMTPRVLSLEGASILANHGHLSYDVIITEGELAGTVWFIDKGVGQSISALPYGFFKKGKPVEGEKKMKTFLSYMEDWVEDAINECNEIYNRKQ